MRKTFLKKARETLQEMRTQLLRNVQAELHEGREQTKDEGMDTYDLASDARDREINFILTDRDREKSGEVGVTYTLPDDRVLTSPRIELVQVTGQCRDIREPLACRALPQDRERLLVEVARSD